MLDVLGLGDTEELAYRALIEMPSADASALAKRLTLRPADAARVLAALERDGLAARSSEHAERYVASPPMVALTALVLERQDQLRHAEAEIASLAESYRRRASDKEVGEAVDVVRGAKAVGQRFVQLQASARDEVLGFIKSDVAVVAPDDNPAEDNAVARGVRYQVIVEQASLERPGFVTAAEAAMANGELVRVAPALPIRMIIVDRQIALVPLVSDEQPAIGALLVHSSGLLDALIALFDTVWREAMPLVLGGDAGLAKATTEGLTELDQRVLGLLLAGLTDEAIGAHLSLSTRTIQRRVRAVMDVAGVETRLQLGYQVAHRGWA